MTNTHPCKDIVDLVAASLAERTEHPYRAVYFMEIALAEAKAEAASLKAEIADVQSRQARRVLTESIADDEGETAEECEAIRARYMADCKQEASAPLKDLATVSHLIKFVRQAADLI